MIQPAMEELAYLAEEVRALICIAFQKLFYSFYDFILEFSGKASG
jgi:hypothetical protein